ncbi:hypothetical protein QBC40DRAFT_325615 [Triangularia verruculosa]|uniref:Uncharacterized protein n=1 Tax=Triangularia verruculosa TaxID=2587418 RepID=A0AAN7B074_9PEZI|nr:hypothetical protein QBC40DRAFT_325615 [Triangularia verruculosa]
MQLLDNLQGNSTALRETRGPSWLDNPDYRGTASIIWSSLITLVACVYSAIHLNIPAPGKNGEWAVLRTKFLWVLIALVAPEVVLVTAFTQFLKAWWLRYELQRLQTSNSTAPAQTPVSLRYCFFVVMGGVRHVFDDVLDDDEIRWLNDRIQESTAVLSPEGVLQLAMLGHSVTVPDSAIEERSKASIIQKCLVLAQVFWMGLQCMVRVGYGFPLALIEIHVLVHVVCAAVMYAFWLKKPLDIREPIVLDSKDIDGVLLLMLELQILASPVAAKTFYIHPPMRPDNAVSSTPPETKTYLGRFDSEAHGTRKSEKMKWVALPRNGGRLLKGEALPCGISFPDETSISGRWLRRLEAVAKVLDDLEQGSRRTGALKSLYPDEFYHVAFARPGANINLELAAGKGSRNLSTRKLMDWVFWVGLLVLPAFYGGVHLSAWKYNFPSTIEAQWWRISCFVVIGGVLVWPCLSCVVVPFVAILTRCQDDKMLDVAVSVTGLIFVLVNIFCRLFLLLDSFIALRASPVGVYLTPPWLQMLPHL